MSDFEYKYPKRTWKDRLFDACFLLAALAFTAFMVYAIGQSILGVASR